MKKVLILTQSSIDGMNYKLAKEKYSLISESIKGKTDKNEIQKIIKGMI